LAVSSACIQFFENPPHCFSKEFIDHSNRIFHANACSPEIIRVFPFRMKQARFLIHEGKIPRRLREAPAVLPLDAGQAHVRRADGFAFGDFRRYNSN